MAVNNYALKLDSADTDRVTLSQQFDVQNLSSFTLEAWVKPGANATSANQRFFSMRQGNSKRGIRLAGVAVTGKLRFEFARADGTSDTNYTYGYDWDDYWHHVAFTVNIESSTYEIYLDGGLVQSGQLVDGGTSLAVSNTDTGGVWVGAWSRTDTESDFIYWDGKIDNIRLWSTVRSQNDIQTSMNDHIDTGTTGLIDEWRFNEGTSFTTNSAKNGYIGTHYRASGTVQTSLHWNQDRPFMGDGLTDSDPPVNPVVSAPTNITSEGFTYNWAATTDDVYVQYYELTVATDSLFSSTVDGFAGINVGLVTTYDIDGLTPSTNYFARLRAFDAAGNASDYVDYNSNAVITTLAASDVTPPEAPVATSATSVTDTGFTTNWNEATDDVAVTGYKLDIALDEDFTTFLGGYRNLDVGDVLTTSASTGVLPGTVYYYRVRAYDAAFNESSDSNTVTLTTSDPPDVEPPSIVVTQAATSVGSTSLTARWNIGVDNVAVTGYRLDVCTDEDMSLFVAGFEDLDVGNVTSWAVTGLTPNTGYFYRVRAYDAADNVSANTETPELAVTRPSTVDDGGEVEVTFLPVQDTYVSQIEPDTNFSDSTVIQSDGNSGAGDQKITYLHFSLTELTGTLVNANLRLYVTPSGASSDVHNVQRALGTLDAPTLTWNNNTLTLDGSTLPFTPSTAETYVEIDIASLLTDGMTDYLIAIHTADTDGAIFYSYEADDFHPELVVEYDPNSSTEPESASASAESLIHTNYVKNPSAETGGPSFAGSTGIDPVGTATIEQDATYAYHGGNSVKVITAAANDGVKFATEAGLNIDSDELNAAKSLVFVRANSVESLNAKLVFHYTDATTSDGTGVGLYSDTEWRGFTWSSNASSGKTIDKIELHVYYAGVAPKTFWVDAALIRMASDEEIVYFDGTSHPSDAEWTGLTNASASTLEGVEVHAVATYLGDGDEDNSIVMRIKRADVDDWFEFDNVSVLNNRATNDTEAFFGPYYLANSIFNPSFTEGTEHWITTGIEATLDQVTDDGLEDAGEPDLACAEITVSGLASSQGVYTASSLEAFQFDALSWSPYLKSVSGETGLELVFHEYDINGAVVATQTDGITITTEWARYDALATVSNSATRFVKVGVHNPSATAAVFRMDHAQLVENSVLLPYIDGEQLDAIWEGRPHRSRTFHALSHDVIYDIEIEYSDPSGVVGTNPVSTQVTTPPSLDDPLTTVALTLTPANDRIQVSATYLGDDNETATVAIQYKRSDLATWSTVSTYSWDRTAKVVSATIANLNPGTDYDVKVTFTDATDVVYGANPLQSSVTTSITGLTSEGRERISFGGFVLSGDAAGSFWVTEHDAFSHPERRTQVEDMPRMDGAVELSDWWGKRVIRMTGGVEGSSRADLYNKIATLRKALAPRKQRLVIDTLANNNYYFTATCTSLGIAEVGGETIRHVTYDAEYTCADPFRYEASETTESDIELSDDDEVVITNDGDIACDPVFSITTTSLTDLTLTIINQSTGERITPDTTIRTADRLVIDSSRLSVTKNGVEVDYAGGFPRLITGQNTIAVVLTSGSISMTIRRRHRYL